MSYEGFIVVFFGMHQKYFNFYNNHSNCVSSLSFYSLSHSTTNFNLFFFSQLVYFSFLFNSTQLRIAVFFFVLYIHSLNSSPSFITKTVTLWANSDSVGIYEHGPRFLTHVRIPLPPCYFLSLSVITDPSSVISSVEIFLSSYVNQSILPFWGAK